MKDNFANSYPRARVTKKQLKLKSNSQDKNASKKIIYARSKHFYDFTILISTTS